MSEDRFAEIMDRQLETPRDGEAQRQDRQKRDSKRGYCHGKSARKRAATRLSR